MMRIGSMGRRAGRVASTAAGRVASTAAGLSIVASSALLTACGVGTMPARYAERPLLVPEGEHQVALGEAPVGEAAGRGGASYRFGLDDGGEYEFPAVLGVRVRGEGEAAARGGPSLLLRGGLVNFGVEKHVEAADDPRASPEEHQQGFAVLRLGAAARWAVRPTLAVVASGHVDRTVQYDTDVTLLTTSAVCLLSPWTHVSFAPGVQWLGAAGSAPSRGPVASPTNRVRLGGGLTDGHTPYWLVAFHLARWADLGLSSGIEYNPRTGEVEADGTVGAELRWD